MDTDTCVFCDNGLSDADKSFLRVLDHDTMIYLYDKEEIEWPTMTEEEIQDRSKADIFSKGIVLLQTTWFIVQCNQLVCD